MPSRKAAWFVRRDSDGRILCVDRKWRSNAGSIGRIKFYSSAGRAHRYGLRGCDGTAYAVYPDDLVDCTGRVTRAQCTDGEGRSDCEVEARLDRLVRSDQPLRLFPLSDC